MQMLGLHVRITKSSILFRKEQRAKTKRAKKWILKIFEFTKRCPEAHKVQAKKKATETQKIEILRFSNWKRIKIGYSWMMMWVVGVARERDFRTEYRSLILFNFNGN